MAARAIALSIVLLAAAAHAQTVIGGDLTVPRANAAVTRLADGRILVTGGHDTAPLASAEIFDASSDAFVRIADMHAARDGHTATLLPDGSVLIAGGGAGAELFIDDHFESVGPMISSRSAHSATLLADGTVLLAGGIDNGSVLTSAEIYDPATRRFMRAGDMLTPRFAHGAVLLPDGRVLVAGGYASPTSRGLTVSAEIYDPVTRTFASAPAPGGAHTGNPIALAGGRILFVGIDDPPLVTSNSEVFDPRTGTFAELRPAWNAFWGATSTLLPNGTVLIAAGGHFYTADELEVFDPATASLREVGRLQTSRSQHAAIVLPDGRVLIAGGVGADEIVLRSAEVFGSPVLHKRRIAR